MQLVLDTNGLTVKKRNESFWIYHKKEKRLISPRRIRSIAVVADCLISAAAIRLAAKHGIPIYFFNGQGTAEARLWSSNFGSQARIRKAQAIFPHRPEAREWGISLFELKTKQQLTCLNYLNQKIRRVHARKSIEMARTEMEQKLEALKKLERDSFPAFRDAIMGHEGGIAKAYWKAVGEVLPEAWTFRGRSRRPARDNFNAALNYLYGMLYNSVGSAVLAAGLDNYLGVLHADDFKRPSFVFDMIEPFRPWVDQLLLEMILRKKLLSEDLEEREAAIRIGRAGRRKLIYGFNAHMQKSRIFQGKRLSSKNHIFKFSGQFAQYLLSLEEKTIRFE